MGFEPALSLAASATCPVALRARIRLCRLPTGSPNRHRVRGAGMRSVGLDVHRDFCEVAIIDQDGPRSRGRVPTTRESLQLFAQSLAPTDRVALEVTGNAWEIARILEPHVARVLVVSPTDTGIRQARAKTDRLDALALAKLLAAGTLDAVWMPDEPVRMMRRRLARRSQLVIARTRVKNEIHAVLVRRLKGRPPASDRFGIKGRRWLAEQELPVVGARDRRRRPAADRVPRWRDRRGRAGHCAASDAVAADRKVDDRSRREPDRRCDVPRRGRRRPAL